MQYLYLLKVRKPVCEHIHHTTTWFRLLYTPFRSPPSLTIHVNLFHCELLYKCRTLSVTYTTWMFEMCCNIYLFWSFLTRHRDLKWIFGSYNSLFSRSRVTVVNRLSLTISTHNWIWRINIISPTWWNFACLQPPQPLHGRISKGEGTCFFCNHVYVGTFPWPAPADLCVYGTLQLHSLPTTLHFSQKPWWIHGQKKAKAYARIKWFTEKLHKYQELRQF